MVSADGDRARKRWAENVVSQSSRQTHFLTLLKNDIWGLAAFISAGTLCSQRDGCAPLMPASPSPSWTLSWDCCCAYIIFWQYYAFSPLNTSHLSGALHAHEDGHMDAYVHTGTHTPAQTSLCTCDLPASAFILAQAHTHTHTHCIPALWIRGTD